MAVYSHITENHLKVFLQQYDIGSLIKFEGILEGIENTNYKITTTKNIYILTIFEKRVKTIDLPFFINLQKHLIKKKFSCPRPIADKKGKSINILNKKSCILISFLNGIKTNIVLNKHCEQVGEILSTLHQYTSDFKEKRSNGMMYENWYNIFLKCKSVNISKKNIINLIEKELSFLKNNWPTDLPKGIVHADVFQDNVFFIDNKFSGLIDFYFSCYDFLAYDIALTINAWCFNQHGKLDKNKLKYFIKGYEFKRKLNYKEKKDLNILLRGASIRILLTRLHDQLFHTEGTFVLPKDPLEYLDILKFHQNNDVNNYL